MKISKTVLMLAIEKFGITHRGYQLKANDLPEIIDTNEYSTTALDGPSVQNTVIDFIRSNLFLNWYEGRIKA